MFGNHFQKEIEKNCEILEILKLDFTFREKKVYSLKNHIFIFKDRSDG